MLIVVAGDDLGGVLRELGDALENILRSVGSEVGDQLVVDREVGGQDEEIIHAVGDVQVADEGTHEPRLAHAGGESEAEGGKLALEIGDGGIFATDDRQRRRDIGRLLGGQDFGEAVENDEGIALRGSQAEATGDGVDVTVHLPASSPNRDCWPVLASVLGTGGGALGRFSTLRL